MTSLALAVGQKIELNDGRVATIRFFGPTSFQPGDWVGVELEESSGKNNGSVKGERYFECEDNYGMFCRPAGVRQILEAPRRAKAGNGVKSRPSSMFAGANGGKKQNLADAAGRRASVLPATPTPGTRLGTARDLRSPVKSPIKQLGSNAPSRASSSQASTPPLEKESATISAKKPRQSIAPQSTAASRRTSVVPPSAAATNRTARPSIAPAANARAPPGRSTGINRTTSDRLAPPPRPAPKQRLSNLSRREDDASETSSPRSGADAASASSVAPSPKPEEDSEADEKDPEQDDTISQPSFAPPPTPSPRMPMTRRTSSPPASIASHRTERTVRSSQASQRQIEELEAKVRLLEKRKQEDRDLRNSLEKMKQEKDKYEGMIQKISTKYQPLQSENAALKKQVTNLESQVADIKDIRDEHDALMELATIDREVAEETAEGLTLELEALRSKNKDIEDELEVLREENDELNKDISPEEKGSVGWLQLEKSNERLREALLRLRDVTQDQEADLRGQLKDLDAQVKDSEEVRKQYQETKELLLRAEADAEDLRQQLEIALGSEEMIEELTERNMSLQGKLEEQRATISDLEDIREINDELEINHVEAEKQMQEEINFKEHLLLERERTAKQLAEGLEDAEYTISRFRELVTTLQSDLADMQASKQISESEAQDLNSKSKAMLDLNLRLQSSAQKTQIKTIDLELRKLEAQEASEHLAIVQLFLPEAFHAERDSVLALLRFKRVGFKANLIHGFVKERVISSGARTIDESVFASCDVMDKLTWITAMSERFVNSICSSAVEEFASYDGALYELEPVERALNGYIDDLRKDELEEKTVANELARSMAVMAHLASIHIRENLASNADEMIMRTIYLQSQLESTASALGLIRKMVERNVSDPNDDDEGFEDDEPTDLDLILNRADSLISHTRSAKVMAGKTQRSLADLLSRGLALEPDCFSSFTSTGESAADLSSYTRQAGISLHTLFSEEGRQEAFVPAEVSSLLSRSGMTIFNLATPESGPFAALSTRLRSLTDALADLAALPSDLDNTVDFERAPAPWVARANQLQQTKLTTVDTEAQLARMTETARERAALLKDRETELEEQSVRVEMLEARMRDAGKRSARIAELEAHLHDAQDREKKGRLALERAESRSRQELDRVREEMSRMADERAKNGANVGELEQGAMGAGARMVVKGQTQQIASLRGAICQLKEENIRLRIPSTGAPKAMTSRLDWLHESLVKPPTERRRQQEALARECKDVLHKMLMAAARPPLVDLTGLPGNKLAWRPVKETSRWKVEASREEWEGWRQWRSEVVHKMTRRDSVINKNTDGAAPPDDRSQ